MRPDIAFAASARSWPDRLHRFLLDHGGGRVVGRVMASEQTETLSCDVLIIDDVCSFLTPHLVSQLKRSGIEVVGVFAPEDGSDAKRRLLECGISDVIEAEATPEEFLKKIDATLAHRAVAPQPDSVTSSVLTIGVTGPTGGVGTTEVSVGLATSLSRRVRTTLVDLDQRWPSVAQRLDLPVHPNIRTAIDHVLHRPDRVESALLDMARLRVVGGRADVGKGSALSKADVLALFDSLTMFTDIVVADLGSLSDVPTGLVREFSTVVVVGLPDPVGVSRVSVVVDSVLGAHPDQSVVAVVNRMRRNGYKRSEIVAELGRAHPTLPVLMLPYEPSVADAAWNGTEVGGGRFAKAMDSMADLIEVSLS